MSDKFKVPAAHIEAHAKLLGEQKKLNKTDSTENKKNTYKVPRAHIEAHERLLKEQQNLQKQIMRLDSITDITRQQKEMEAQLKSLQQEQMDKEKTNKEFKYLLSD